MPIPGDRGTGASSPLTIKLGASVASLAQDIGVPAWQGAYVMAARLRVSLDAVIVYGDEYMSVVLQEGAKRRRVQLLERMGAPGGLPTGGGGGVFWQDVVGAPRDVEWQCLIEEHPRFRTWATLTAEWAIG